MKKIFILVLASIPFTGMAQSDDFGVYTSIDIVKTVSNRLCIGAGAEYRSHDNAKTTDRYSFGISADYKLSPWLSVGAGYDLLKDNIEKYSYSETLIPQKYVKYWRPRHRFHVDFTGKLSYKNIRMSLRERWQYTYRPQKTVDGQYDYGIGGDDDVAVIYPGAGDNVLRSRVKLEYVNRTFITPYASVEMYNGWEVEKMKYIVGTDFNVSAMHKFSLYYMYQAVSTSDPNIHVVAAGYKFSF
jgi:hypothetical protein